MKTTIKARVLATNEVVRVYQAKEGDMHFIDENNNPYKCEELDFNVEEETSDPIERLERMMEIFKPANYAKIEGVTPKCIYDRIKRGGLQHVVISGVYFIVRPTGA